MDDLKEIVFYQAHKLLSKDLQEFLLGHFTAKNVTGLSSDWTAFEPTLNAMKKNAKSRVRHLAPYFSEVKPRWTEYITILDVMVENYKEASKSISGFEFQLNYVENCWKSNRHPLSWSNINIMHSVSSMSQMIFITLSR